MQKIAIFNQKGGVGKSSLTVNLAAAIYKLKPKKRILVIDCDGQANASSYFMAFGHQDGYKTLIDYLNGDSPIEDCLHRVYFNTGRKIEKLLETNIDIIPVDDQLDHVSMDDVNVLSNIIRQYEDDYDYCFLDCSPQRTTGVMLALCACDYVLVPMNSGDLDSVHGWSMLLNLVDEVKDSHINDNIRILGVVVNFFIKKRSVHVYMSEVFENTFGDYLFNSYIRDSADIEQAKMFRQPVCYYKPSSLVSQDYEALAREFERRLKSMEGKVGK